MVRFGVFNGFYRLCFVCLFRGILGGRRNVFWLAGTRLDREGIEL